MDVNQSIDMALALDKSFDTENCNSLNVPGTTLRLLHFDIYQVTNASVKYIAAWMLSKALLISNITIMMFDMTDAFDNMLKFKLVLFRAFRKFSHTFRPFLDCVFERRLAT